MQKASKILAEVCERWGLDALAEDLSTLEQPQQLTIGFLGDFSSGKSTLINKVAGVPDLMPTRVEPCTAQAGFVVAVDGQVEPTFHRMDAEGELHPVSRPEFDDLARGLGEGRPVAHVAPCPGLPAGFVLADTPGLASLQTSHIEATFGELPFMDAVVLCLDLQKGGVSKANLDFLTQPVLAGLRDRLLVALTHGDKRSSADAEKIRTKVIGTLSKALSISETVLAERVHITAAVSDDPAQIDVAAFRESLDRLLAAKRTQMQQERREHTAHSLLPRAQRLLREKIQHLSATDEAAMARRAEIEAKIQDTKKEWERFEARLKDLQTSLDHELQSVAKRFVAPLADARTEQEVNSVCEKLLNRLTHTAQELVGEFASSMHIELASLDSELRSTLGSVNRTNELAVTLVTGALMAVLIPGGGVAGNAVQATGGAAAKQVALKTSAMATTKVVGLKALVGLAKVIRDVNPVQHAGNFFARSFAEDKAKNSVPVLAADVSHQTGRQLAAAYRSLHFDPLERELHELRSALEQAETERRKSRAEVNQLIESAEQDLKRLQQGT